MILFRVILSYFLIYLVNVTFADYQADYVIVGGGTAGCVLAFRLSKDSLYRVLVLEAGEEPDKFNVIPYFAPGPFDGRKDWGFSSEPDQNSCLAYVENRCYLPQGKGLGGSTQTDSMIFARGNAKDFSRWESMGNDGWGFDDVLLYFKKLENYLGSNSDSNAQYHGFSGPVNVSNAPYESDFTQVVINAGNEWGYSDVDYNAGSQRGFSRAQYAMKNGRRLTVYEAYVVPVKNRQNLQILTNAVVTQIEFDRKKRATSVVFTYQGKLQKAKANKEVILTAGTINSPKLLQLSGIGPKQLLDQFKIPIVHESPGVGNNLRDHLRLPSLFLGLTKQVGFWQDFDMIAENLEKFEHDGQGPLTVPHRIYALGYLDTENNSRSNPPDILYVLSQGQQAIARDSQLKKEYQITNDQLECLSMLEVEIYVLSTKSVGSVMIKSTSPEDPPEVKLNLLSHPLGVIDFTVFVQAQSFKPYGGYYPQVYPIGPCANLISNLTKFYDCYIRLHATSGMNMAGTCKMGPKNDSSAVVDPQVIGVTNLRVVDYSVAPFAVSGPSMGPTLMIAEKGADMIIASEKKLLGIIPI